MDFKKLLQIGEGYRTQIAGAVLIVVGILGIAGYLDRETLIGLATTACGAIAITLRLAMKKLPQEQQDALFNLFTKGKSISDQIKPQPPTVPPVALLLVMVTGLCLGCQQPPPEPPSEPATKTVAVPVQRHRSVSLTEAEADRILADMTAVLAKSDRAGDSAVPIRFVRAGKVGLLPLNVPAVIQTAAQFQALVNAHTGVKVVRGINWCGGPGGGIIGCAPLGVDRANLGVVRFEPSQEGILWAHEFGHNCGLNHRTNDRRAIMYPAIGLDHRVITAAEANRYLLGPSAMLAAEHGECPCEPVPAEAVPADIRDLVSQNWAHGVPDELIRRYPATVEPDLIGLLESGNEAHLPNVTKALCLLGSDAAVPSLTKLLKRPATGDLRLRAKHAAALHLGDLIRRTGNADAIQCLADIAGTPKVAQRAVSASVTSPSPAVAGVELPTVDELADEIAVSAMIGLTTSNTDDTRAVVEAIKNLPTVSPAVQEVAEHPPRQK